MDSYSAPVDMLTGIHMENLEKLKSFTNSSVFLEHGVRSGRLLLDNPDGKIYVVFGEDRIVVDFVVATNSFGFLVTSNGTERFFRSRSRRDYRPGTRQKVHPSELTHPAIKR